jgi:hypothetical protein
MKSEGSRGLGFKESSGIPEVQVDGVFKKLGRNDTLKKALVPMNPRILEP